MRRLLLPIAALLISDALLLAGHGLQLTLLPLRGAIEGFSDTEIGLTGSAYFLGFVAGCLITPWIVRRAGHIRSFAVLASGFSALVLMFDLLPIFWFWLLLRFVTGACISGLYMIIESWLNERATRENRGTVLSIYTIINLLMIVVGQQLVNLADPEASTLFAVAAILLSLAIIPVSMTTALAPAPLVRVKLSPMKVWRLSKVGVGGTVAAGLATGAFWSLGPLYAREVGMDTAQLTLFMSSAVLGGAALQFPLGRLSDHFDRRLVVLGAALVGAGLSMALGTIPDLSGWLRIGLVFFWGGTTMTLYAICLAHANDRADPVDFVMVGTSILLSFGVASAIGAPLAALTMGLVGGGGLFLFAGLVLALLALGVVRRRHTHYLPVVDETVPFRAVADVTTPAALEMDPRMDAAAIPQPEPPGSAPGDEPPAARPQ
ncbi:MAG: MFS transporter [Gammaproteobacteria bacterium]|nr:MFS transporter [Gammaproteobacteria bacterium]